MLAPGGEVERQSAWNDFALDSLRLYPEFVAELCAESGCPIDYQQLGAVELALSDTEWESLGRRRRIQQSLRIPSRELSAQELRTLVPGLPDDMTRAVFYPEDALVDPRDLMRALRTACLARGVEIREGFQITEIRPGNDRVAVIADEGIFEAPAAVLAAGAWSSLIPVRGPELPRAFPVRGHLVGFQLAPGSLGPIVRHGHTYLLQRAGGFTIAGTSSEDVGFDRQLNPAIVSAIQERASRLLPELAGRPPDQQWVGFRPAIDAPEPVVGRLGDTSLWLAYGHYRNGILLAPATAERVARQIIASSETGWSWQFGKR
jgi:glycine oxidase